MTRFPTTTPPQPGSRRRRRRTADFYRNLLELTVELPRDQDSYGAAIATLQDPWGYQYHFIPDDPGGFAARHGLPVNPLGSGHLAFRVDDIAAVRARLDAEISPTATWASGRSRAGISYSAPTPMAG